MFIPSDEEHRQDIRNQQTEKNKKGLRLYSVA
uniref:Uncharacterized protein n=1 Tax=Rhizophora mucronata TaxID=61149 RepID=A0A2P2Q5E1_RHIMU